jgi:hypothetical protein
LRPPQGPRKRGSGARAGQQPQSIFGRAFDAVDHQELTRAGCALFANAGVEMKVEGSCDRGPVEARPV